MILNPQKQAIFLAAFTSTLLIGCAGDPVAISAISKDKKAFITQNFNRQSVSASVLNKLPADDSAAQSKTLKFNMTSKILKSDGKEIARQIEMTYTPIGNGLVQVFSEFSSNGIPLILNFSLNYKGIRSLKWMSADPAYSYSDQPYEIKEVSSWDKIGSAAGDTFSATYSWARVMQIVSYSEGKEVCKVTKIIPAKEVHASLTGNARELACEVFNNGLTNGLNNYIYIEALGYAIPTHYTRADLKETRTIDSISEL